MSRQLAEDLAGVEGALLLAASRARNIEQGSVLYRAEAKRILVDPIDALIKDCHNMQLEAQS